MNMQSRVHEPDAALLSAEDAIQDAERIRALLERNRQRAEPAIELRVPLSVFLDAIERLNEDELRELRQRLDERLAAVNAIAR